MGMKLRTGKNSKTAYDIKSYFHLSLPCWLLKLRKRVLLRNVEQRKDWAAIRGRVNYYCKDMTSLDKKQWEEESVMLCTQKILRPKVYYLDSIRYIRYFPQNLYWHICSGDVNYVPALPSIVKSRPIDVKNENAVLLNLNRVRHFVFLNDHIDWQDKEDKLVFRGSIGQKEGVGFKQNRYLFMQRFFNHPLVDAGEVMEGGRYVNPEWGSTKLTLYDHLRYKFVLALEGNDVASNLKWIMSSNSIAVMPRPKFETWFMEGKLVADYHYIEIASDFSDLEEKLTYYLNHPAKAQAIIEHAHEYVNQFRNDKREAIISLLVLDKYFNQTNYEA